MLWVYSHYKYFNSFSAGIDFKCHNLTSAKTSGYDFWSRSPHCKSKNIYYDHNLLDPYHRYSNESEKANQDIYDDFKMKLLFDLHGLYKNISAF